MDHDLREIESVGRVDRDSVRVEYQHTGRMETAMKRLIRLALMVIVTALAACRESGSGLITGTGSIHPSAFECSAWFVHADSGREYQLTHLASELQRGGLRVRFTLRKRNDLASTCMAGDIADVVSLTKL